MVGSIVGIAQALRKW